MEEVRGIILDILDTCKYVYIYSDVNIVDYTRWGPLFTSRFIKSMNTIVICPIYQP